MHNDTVLILITIGASYVITIYIMLWAFTRQLEAMIRVIEANRQKAYDDDYYQTCRRVWKCPICNHVNIETDEDDSDQLVCECGHVCEVDDDDDYDD